MSTHLSGNFSERPEVIVRGFRGQPARLRAIGVRGRLVDVAGSNPRKMIGVPADDVFRYSDAEFESLKRAFDTGDVNRLASLWRDAESFDPSA